MANGQAGLGIAPGDPVSEPDIALALPEQLPDQLTYVVELRPDVRFQNGRYLTSEDVKYSLERYAFDADSAWKEEFSWLEKVETPARHTVVIRSKSPYADGIGSLTAKDYGFILAREHEEGSDADSQLLGTGPFTLGRERHPFRWRFRRFSDYYAAPSPYFEVVDLVTGYKMREGEADFAAGRLHVAAPLSQSHRDWRAGGKLWRSEHSGLALAPTVDRAPFIDRRVRQALSMSIDREHIRDRMTRGEGEPDTVFTWVAEAWGFRKPAQLGPLSRYWKYDPSESRKLLSAAGIVKPFDATLLYSPTYTGDFGAGEEGRGLEGDVGREDYASILTARWSKDGIAAVEREWPFAREEIDRTSFQNPVRMFLGPHAGGGVLSGPAIGIPMKGNFSSLPGSFGMSGRNPGAVEDRRLSDLLEKQLSQLNQQERQATFAAIEELMAEEQYRIMLSTTWNNVFTDPQLRGVQIPSLHSQGSAHYIKYWEFS